MPSHDIITVNALRTQLAKAIQLEHSAIPPYLTALYSIMPGCNVDAVQIFRVVAVEEMLHLTLAANLLNAVGGKPDLTRPGFVSCYPAPLVDGETDFEVGLAPFGRDLINTVLNIERPAMAGADGKPSIVTRCRRHRSPLIPSPPGRPDLRYYSIGEFYRAILDGIVYLEDAERKAGRCLFVGDTGKQVTSEYYYSGGGTLRAVTDLESARAAIELIIQQGEGELRAMYGPDGEIAHYYRFRQILNEQYYMPNDKADSPTGPKFAIDYEAVYPIKPNIKLADYPSNSELYAAARSFNEDYAVFLAMLTKAFSGQPELLLEAVPRMFEFRNRFDILVRNPLPGTPYHAGPTFEIGPCPEHAADAEQ